MSRVHISTTIRRRVAEAARYRCGYCQTQQAVIGIPLHIEHIIPLALGGSSNEDNLWLACSACNNYKGVQTQALDPETKEQVLLFNPRTQLWADHFAWSDDRAEIIGLTAMGRATVEALKLNQPLIRLARRRWVVAGWHPPTD
ncbi:MAG: HNH endonuclease [Anaerolineae bacterium]|nr:HNH endonuclease [Anaerolineales bacterium]MCQ3972467.1 HNH endonuclease [Anaerolineae bacterium]